MPTSQEILYGLTTIANEWRIVAVAWHVAAGALLLGLVIGWRPSKRLAGVLLTLPLASVSVLAWHAGNPFNGIAFAGIVLILVLIARTLPLEPIAIGSVRGVLTGSALVLFGWVYPHFLRVEWWAVYLYAAPLGLVPCPTLAAVVGVALIVRLLESSAWSAILSAAALLYGLIGVFRLGVLIDLFLVAGAASVWIVAIASGGRHRDLIHFRT